MGGSNLHFFFLTLLFAYSIRDRFEQYDFTSTSTCILSPLRVNTFSHSTREYHLLEMCFCIIVIKISSSSNYHRRQAIIVVKLSFHQAIIVVKLSSSSDYHRRLLLLPVTKPTRCNAYNGSLYLNCINLLLLNRVQLLLIHQAVIIYTVVSHSSIP